MQIIKKLIISVFCLFGVVSFVIFFYNAPKLGYGEWRLTYNHALLLAFGLYALLINCLLLKDTLTGWRNNDNIWFENFKISHNLIFVFSALIIILFIFIGVFKGYKTSYEIHEIIARAWMGIFIGMLPYLFAIGLCLCTLAIVGMKNRGNQRINITRKFGITGIIFLIVGFLPTILLLIILVGGGDMHMG